MKRIVLFLVAVLLLLPMKSGQAARGDLIDPAKARDSIRISTGQQFTVAFDQRGDRLVNPRRVQSAQKRSVVTLNFFVERSKSPEMRVLVVTNFYPRILRYRAAARTGTQREFLETNMIPIHPNIPSYEGWLDPFVELLLFDFQIMK
ncbi:MAG TPA: hypothetical protein VM940_15805 [Chthoniobacterales bacterium]|jgi:hypothetical protein|nr:hypothetical protein [Chthoniobacterales bacterium]